MANQEIVTFAEALSRVGLGDLATDMHQTSLVEWNGYPTPFSCGRYTVIKNPAWGPRMVRMAQSHVGDGCVLFRWSLMAKSRTTPTDHYKIGEAWVAVSKSDKSQDMYLLAGLS